MWPIATDVWRGLSVCRYVCDVMDRYPGKMAGPMEMPFGMCDGVGPSNHVLDGGPDPGRGRGNCRVRKGHPVVNFTTGCPFAQLSLYFTK